jgi:hypothetical protein
VLRGGVSKPTNTTGRLTLRFRLSATQQQVQVEVKAEGMKLNEVGGLKRLSSRLSPQTFYP